MRLMKVMSGNDKVDEKEYRITFKLPSDTDLASTTKTDQQFADLKKQGYKVPRRMTKEDIAKAQQRLMSMGGQKIGPKKGGTTN